MIPNHYPVRPTSSRVREAVMSAVKHLEHIGKIPPLSTSKMLDLCCGTGIVGMEFLSNHTGHVTFIDAQHDLLLHIEKLAKHWHIDPTRFHAHTASIGKNALHDALDLGQFDILYFDPPYRDKDLYKTILGTLNHAWEKQQKPSLCIVEQSKKMDLDIDRYNHIDLYAHYKYGKSHLYFLMQKENHA